MDRHKPPLTRRSVVYYCSAVYSRIYAACSSGVIGVYQEDDPDHFRKLEGFPVQPMVHSLAVDTATHRVYAPEQQEDGRPVARMVIYEPVEGTPGVHIKPGK